ncbi:major capsid protein [Dipodfec virus UA06Rod_21]|uniref:Major capsid protein n=1 Tax=Dipodfec virus UA06Rod_21 TaxID=2929321 RepID=A0A976N1Y4_9VIRU|nr:major capsid protein [Dipodfec virus UA06Rod_21]
MSTRTVVYRAPRINKFPVKWTRDYTIQMGQIVPIMCEYAMPNSYWKLRPIHKLRTMPLVAPYMHDTYVSCRYFRIPLRLLMNESSYSSYMTGGKNDDDATPTPTVNSGASGYAPGSLMDYLGYSSNYVNDNNDMVVLNNFTQNAWALRAYWQTINDWFINTNITDPVEFSREPGLDTTTPKDIFSVAWGFDRFVQAMPSLSRGDNVYLPLGTQAPVYGNDTFTPMSLRTSDNRTGLLTQYSVDASGHQRLANSGSANSGNGLTVGLIPKGTESYPGSGIYDSGVYTDLSSASALDVNDLRNTLALGMAKNLSMYIGNRFQDWLYGVFGARASDARLQRAEYLGGAVSPLYINDVDQTSATQQDETPQGNLAGKGIAFNGDVTIKCYCEEPCVILGVMYVLPKATYFQGSRKWMNYNTRYDYPNPLYAKISDQTILEKEILAQPDDASTEVTVTNDEGQSQTISVKNDTIFGFEPRYEEARSFPSTVHGDLRGNLKFWSLVREFDKASPPMLNSSFIYAQNVSKRVFADTSSDFRGLIVHSLFRGSIKQPLPKNDLPSSMGLLFGGDTW